MRKLILIFATLLITTEMFAEFSRDNEKEIVTDNITGLIWQDDNVTKEMKIKWDDDAHNYCKALTLGEYDDWRLPSIEELQTITDYSRFNPAIKKEFVNFASDYWSSTVKIKNSTKVFTGISVDSGVIFNGTSYARNVRCVRGGYFGTFDSFAEYQRSSFTRDDNTKIVTDTKNNLQWQDNEAVKLTNKKWADAIHYCKELKLGGYNNWRLPSIGELQIIMDYNSDNATLNNAFVNYFDSSYWSSTAYVNRIDHAWTINTMNGIITSSYNKPPNKMYTRCVRDTTPLTLLESTSLSSDDNATKEIQHYSYPAVSDFIIAKEPDIDSMLGDDPDVKWSFIKKIAKNKSLYQNKQGNRSVVLVKNGKKVDIESIRIDITITDPYSMDTDKVAILRRLGIDTNETANTLVLVCDNKRLQLTFDADSSSLFSIEITKEQK